MAAERHPSQIGKNGLLLPQWPDASHFADWEYLPFRHNNQMMDLYFYLSGKTGPSTYGSMNTLLIGLQQSEEDGDYLSPFITGENALHFTYVINHRHEVMSAYLLACATLGIQPSISKP